jgi:glycosyltransferase involved in cell wall biosynthesis
VTRSMSAEIEREMAMDKPPRRRSVDRTAGKHAVPDRAVEVRPLVSVIVAAYNASLTIGETIRSVLGQTRQDFEIVVVDDGSTDDTGALVTQWLADPRVRLYHQENAGPAAARNAGIAHAHGDYLSMLDSDDLWLPYYLERMVLALQESPEAGFAYTDAWALEQASGRIRRATAMSRQRPPERTLPATAFLEALVQRNFIFNSVTVRREVLEHVGGYDPEIPQAEDYELWLRSCAAGYTGLRVPGPLAIYRVHDGSLSQDELGLLTGLCDAYRAVIDRHPAPEDVKAIARERLHTAERRLEALQGRSTPARAYPRTRHMLAASTHKWRTRRRLLATPPPEVAKAFPELGDGKR